MFDGKAFGDDIVGVVKGYLEREMAPLKAENAELKERLAALEARPAPEKGEPGERGVDGVSPEPAAIVEASKDILGETIKEMLDHAMSQLAPPEKGEKGDTGDCGEKGEPGQNGKDGAGIVDGFLSRDGHLIATFSDGSTKDFGEVVGKDGCDGADGKDGEPGRDGFGFDDMDACVLDDDRTIEWSFRRGDEEKAFTFKWPTVVYRNVYREGEQYERGDMVTWAGSLWHCDEPTKDKPGTDSWTLAAKKGRDGKDAKVG